MMSVYFSICVGCVTVIDGNACLSNDLLFGK